MPLWNGTDMVKAPKAHSRCEQTLKSESAWRKGLVFSSTVGVAMQQVVPRSPLVTKRKNKYEHEIPKTPLGSWEGTRNRPELYDFPTS